MSDLLAKRTIVAHRGGRGLGPENSLEAARASFAIAGGSPVIALAYELDVQLSRDSQWLVMHDPTLDRTTELKDLGELDQMSLEEIGQARLEHSQTLETVSGLHRFLAQIPPVQQLFIEIKPTLEKCESALQQLIQLALDSPIEVVLITFELPVLRRLRQLGAGKLGFLFEQLSDLDKLEPTDQFEFWGPDLAILDAELVARIGERGGQLNPWTVNLPDDFQRLTDWGIGWMTTDQPDLLYAFWSQQDA